jgi:O-antigen/teichoic acid export membrane protein
VLGNDIAGRGRPGLNSWVSGFSVAANLVLNFALDRRYGLNGAAWSSTVSYSAYFLMMLVLYCKIAKVSPRAVLVPTGSDMGGYRRAAGRLAKRLSAQA